MARRPPTPSGEDERCFGCPFLGQPVWLTLEREVHVLGAHPELHEGLHPRLTLTLAASQSIRRSSRSAAVLLFSRWYPDLLGGKHLVAAVVQEPAGRAWIVTAYVARKLSGGFLLWRRS